MKPGMAGQFDGMFQRMYQQGMMTRQAPRLHYVWFSGTCQTGDQPTKTRDGYPAELFRESMLVSTATLVQIPKGALRFWRDGEGTLILDKDDAEQYGQWLDALGETVSDKEQASPKAIELALQTALFTVFDIPKSRSPDLRVRLDEAITGLRQFLRSKPQRFRVVVPVNGLDVEGLPTWLKGACPCLSQPSVLGEPLSPDFPQVESGAAG
jgi:hypothetical protein